jgi:predicted aspartyl protease
VIRGEILTGDGSWVQAPFLVDTAADRTVLSANILEALRLQPLATPQQLSGVGGVVTSTVVETHIQFPREDTGQVVFRGQYAAVTDLEALDMSVLGRDLTNFFAVIVDRPRDVVCLLGQRHQYTIEQR